MSVDSGLSSSLHELQQAVAEFQSADQTEKMPQATSPHLQGASANVGLAIRRCEEHLIRLTDENRQLLLAIFEQLECNDTFAENYILSSQVDRVLQSLRNTKDMEHVSGVDIRPNLDSSCDLPGT